MTDNINIITETNTVVVSPTGTPGSPGGPGLDWINSPWVIGDEYEVRDALFHDGASYRVTTAHTSSVETEPGVGEDWESVWSLIAAGLDIDPDDISVVVDNIDAIVNAPVAAAEANYAAERAEAASDSAFVSADVYPDVATGRASVADGEQFQVVSGDEVIRYRRDSASAQTEVARYPTADAINAIPTKINVGEDIEILHDITGQIVRRTDAMGRVYVPGMGGDSLQEVIDRSTSAAEVRPAYNGSDIFNLESTAGSVTIRQDRKGGLHIPGIPGTVQEALGYGFISGGVQRRKSSRDLLVPSVRELMLDLVANSQVFVPPPVLLVPNGYSIPDSFVNAFTVSVPDPTPIASPYADDDLTVHNYTVEMPRLFRGYRYIMGMTPYRNTRMENPVMYGSNDLINFEMLDGIDAPIGWPFEQADAGYAFCSDVGLTYDPVNGEFIVFWRNHAGHMQYYCRRSVDGYNWTPQEVFWESPDGGDTGHLSPAVLYNPADGLWHMWNCRVEDILNHHTAPSLTGPWTMVHEQNINVNFGISPWHLEVKYMGSKYVILVNQRIPNSNLYFGVSDNGNDWVFGGAIIDPPQDGTYKASFMPEFSGDELRMVIVWNTNITVDPDDSRRLFIARTNPVDVTTL